MSIACFHSDEEAVQLANDCCFGLGAAIFSGSRGRAQRICSRLQVLPWHHQLRLLGVHE